MEAGGKDSEEETLQTAFKKLRVDAERAVSVCEGSRGTSRVCLENNGTKPKLSCTKDTWHGCTRKSSRGVCRSQRRRRSKSPILHPPRFTYCSSSSALSPSGGRLKPADIALPVEGKEVLSLVTETPSSLDAVGNANPLFGSCIGKDKDSSDLSDFATLSDSSHVAEARPDLSSVEVYSFTGLRRVVSECERSREASRTLSGGVSAAGGAARSCSEQARGFVDDVTIEDLSGYMEYYLYIPKKMSHMAEMMYT
ncbi:oxidative stress-responsive serine-rich protein 1 [Gouania willdenowi]|uniref:oxidative stress-responsive serine-rich protein 1 n=1 Tax=Gouania willdenowi TaxID=441366 RepID=UPI0010543116|nr:oxidative stress-responsive serine-rich protein 1 [Gouania willdenowi]XP_028302215.1 oxidative stress-responsive serine-rich protein 1 [Gouania willdenowi]XP_028302216.1 oxidative stress-responsive serine-rich protein 1 [Gouania willdenowi]XP_028302217.1 oxidative stress-responsive serine-rich protein 1 [Gouania willdenowi]